MIAPFKIENHKVVGIPFQEAVAIYGEIKPRILVVHDTAGRLDKGNSAGYLRKHPKISVHFVIERDGTIVQQVPLNRRAGHAGQSHYHGYDDVNEFSIGIELVNPGAMQDAGKGRVKPWFDRLFPIAKWGIERRETAEHGDAWWMPYDPRQLDALFGLAPFLVDELQLTDIVPHWYVSPGRKVDTNPLFPLSKLKAHCFGREHDPELLPDVIADMQPDVEAQAYGAVRAHGDTLNLRKWPSFNPNVLNQIPDGVVVPIIKAGLFPLDAPHEQRRKWLKVAYGSAEGWVIARYIEEDEA